MLGENNTFTMAIVISGKICIHMASTPCETDFNNFHVFLTGGGGHIAIDKTIGAKLEI